MNLIKLFQFVLDTTNNLNNIATDFAEETKTDKSAKFFEGLYQESLITEKPTTSELHNVQYTINLKKTKIDPTFKGFKNVKNIIESQKLRTNKLSNNSPNTNDEKKDSSQNTILDSNYEHIDNTSNLSNDANNNNNNNNNNNGQNKIKDKDNNSTNPDSPNKIDASSSTHNNKKKNLASSKTNAATKTNTIAVTKINPSADRNLSSTTDTKINIKRKSRTARSSLQPKPFYSNNHPLTIHRSLTNITMNATRKMKEEATKRAVLLNKKNDLQMEINQINKKNKADIESLKKEIELLTEENIKLNKYSSVVGPTIDPQYKNQLLQDYNETNFDYLQNIVEIRQNTHQNYEDEIDTLAKINDALFSEYEKRFPGQSFRNLNSNYKNNKNNNNDDEYYYDSEDSELTSYSASIGSPDDYFTASSIGPHKKNEMDFNKESGKLNKEENQNENKEEEQKEETEKNEDKETIQNDEKGTTQNEDEKIINNEKINQNENEEKETSQSAVKKDQMPIQNQHMDNSKNITPPPASPLSDYSSNNSLSNDIPIIPRKNPHKIDNLNSNSSSDNLKHSIKNDHNKDILNVFSNAFSRIKQRSNSTGNLLSKDYGEEDDTNKNNNNNIDFNHEEDHSDFSNNSSNSNRYVNLDYQDLGPEYEQGFQDVDDEIRSLPRESSEENDQQQHEEDKKGVKFVAFKTTDGNTNNNNRKDNKSNTATYSDDFSSDFVHNNNNININNRSSSILKSENESDYFAAFVQMKKKKDGNLDTFSEIDIMDVKLPTLDVTSNPTSGSIDKYNKNRYAFNMTDEDYSSEYLRHKRERLERRMLEEEEENDKKQKNEEKKRRKRRKRKSIQQKDVQPFVIEDLQSYIEEDNKRLKNEITNLKYQNFLFNTQKVSKRKEVFDVISLKTKSNKELEVSSEVVRLQNRDLVERIKEIEGFIQDEEELIQRFIALQTQTIINPTAEANAALQSRFSLIKKESLKLDKFDTIRETKSSSKKSRRSSTSARTNRQKEKRSLKLYDVSENARETFMVLEKARANLNDTIEKAKYLLNDLEKDENLSFKKVDDFLSSASEDSAFLVRIQIENERIESELKNLEEEAFRVSRRFGGVPNGKGTRRALLSLKRTMITLINRNQTRAMEALKNYLEQLNESKTDENEEIKNPENKNEDTTNNDTTITTNIIDNENNNNDEIENNDQKENNDINGNNEALNEYNEDKSGNNRNTDNNCKNSNIFDINEEEEGENAANEDEEYIENDDKVAANNENGDSFTNDIETFEEEEEDINFENDNNDGVVESGNNENENLSEEEAEASDDEK